VLAWTDPLGTKPSRIKIQVKRRKDNIAVDELRSFMALLGEQGAGRVRPVTPQSGHPPDGPPRCQKILQLLRARPCEQDRLRPRADTGASPAEVRSRVDSGHSPWP
jgi:hypothetical protein